jgi:DNA polymerase-3 subunit beta
MKFQVNRSALSQAVGLSFAAVAARCPKPVLQCLLLTADLAGLQVYGTDLEVSIDARIDGVQVDEPGRVAVNAAQLRDILRESPEDVIRLESNGDTLNVRTDSGHFKLFTQDVKEFPPEPKLEKPATFSVGVKALQAQINRVDFAIAKESTRYAFNGALFKVEKKKLLVVATDGRRLALSTTPLTEAQSCQAVIPAKVLALVSKLNADKPEDQIEVQISENRVAFTTPTVSIASALVEGTFPPYADVIPKDCDKKVILTKASFISAVRRTALLQAEEGKGIAFDFSQKGLVLSSRAPDAGEATVNYPCKFEGAGIKIGFNPQYVLDGVKVADAEEVSLEMTAPNRPGLLRAGDWLCVVMPVNLE